MNVVDIALAKKYTKDTAEGIGYTKGNPCTISKTETVADGTEITFQWTGNDGSSKTQTIKVKDGISVEGIIIGSGNHLLITLSNDIIIDAGELPIADNANSISYTNPSKPDITNVKNALDAAFNQSAENILYSNSTDNTLTNVKLAIDKALSQGAKLEQSLTVSNPVGSATNGKTYAKDTQLETILRDILIKEEAPTLTLNISPSKTLYDVVENTVSAVAMNAVVGKKTYNLSKIEYYVNNVLKHTQNITTGGTYTYNVSFSPATNSDFTLKAIVYDSRAGTPMSTTKSTNVKFVGKSYYGFVADNIGIPTESQVKALQNNVLKDTKNLKYSNITFDYNKVVYAYPSSFGNLTSIKDEIGNFDYTSSFSKQNLTIDSIAYTLYIQNDASASDSVELTFK